MTITIFETMPKDFKPTLEVSAVYLDVNGKFLILQRAANKSEGKTWGMPAGKIDAHETPEEGAYRELFEETGIRLAPESLKNSAALYGVKMGFHYIYYMFGVKLGRMPEVTISDEHIAYQWATVSEIADLEMMEGAHEALRIHLLRFN